MREQLTVDGKDLADFGVYISGDGTFSAPEKDYTWYNVPSRNGSVLGYQRRLENIDVSYECGIYTNFDTNIADLRSFLLSRNGLVRISDTYHPNEYRMGVYAGAFDPTVERTLDAGRFTLTFNCLPQRWLTSGENIVTVTAVNTSVALPNPTHFYAMPMIRVYGYGTFSCGTPLVLVDVLQHSEAYCDIDCETMNCYCGATNLCNYVAFRNGLLVYGQDAPKLAPGGDAIKIQSGSNITKIEVTPRYWEV